MYYVVVYAKITTEKSGITLHGTYFGGVTKNENEAHEIARECVSRVKCGTILTKIITTQEEDISEAISEAIKKFDLITSQMQEAEKIINRTQGMNK